MGEVIGEEEEEGYRLIWSDLEALLGGWEVGGKGGRGSLSDGGRKEGGGGGEFEMVEEEEVLVKRESGDAGGGWGEDLEVRKKVRDDPGVFSVIGGKRTDGVETGWESFKFGGPVDQTANCNPKKSIDEPGSAGLRGGRKLSTEENRKILLEKRKNAKLDKFKKKKEKFMGKQATKCAEWLGQWEKDEK
jgi:hypothetical protein